MDSHHARNLCWIVRATLPLFPSTCSGGRLARRARETRATHGMDSHHARNLCWIVRATLPLFPSTCSGGRLARRARETRAPTRNGFTPRAKSLLDRARYIASFCTRRVAAGVLARRARE